MKILFVCTGNTCRSPMAEAVFNNLCIGSKREHSSFSRGINVIVPQPISEKSRVSLGKKGIVLNKSLSQQLVFEDIKNADIILTMTSSHKMTLKSVFPEYKSKIFTLNEKALGKDSDIADPFGLPQESYDKCCDEIIDAVGELLCSI